MGSEGAIKIGAKGFSSEKRLINTGVMYISVILVSCSRWSEFLWILAAGD